MASVPTIDGRNALTIFEEVGELVQEAQWINAGILERAAEGDHAHTVPLSADLTIKLLRIAEIVGELRSGRPNDALDSVLGIDRQQHLRLLADVGNSPASARREARASKA